VSLSPAQAHQEGGERVTQKTNINKGPLCTSRRTPDQLLEIITTNRHKVLFYDTTGNHQRHLSRGGKIKLTRLSGPLEKKKMKIKMKQKGKNKWDLKELVTAEITRTPMLLGDIISIVASTNVTRSNQDQVLHKYIFDFYVPCEYETVGYFMFDFWDIDEVGKQRFRDGNHNVSLGPINILSHSRGTGGGRSN